MNQPSNMAWNAQVEMHDSHRMHFVKSMENGCLISPEIAFTGQDLEHLEQPLQSSGSIQMR